MFSSARRRSDCVSATARGSCPKVMVPQPDWMIGHRSLVIDDGLLSVSPRLRESPHSFHIYYTKHASRSTFYTPPPHPGSTSQSASSSSTSRASPSATPPHCLYIDSASLPTQVIALSLFLYWTHGPNSWMHLPRLSQNSCHSVLHC